MPCVGQLQIESCRRLKMLPDGLRFITTLQQLKIEKMPKAFKDRVEKGREDFNNVRLVPSITFKGCVLIQLWVAEGIVLSEEKDGNEGSITEDLAERYLMELVERCMLQGPFRIKDFNAEDLHMNQPIIQSKYLHSLSIFNDAGRIDPRHLNHLLSTCVSISKLSLDVEMSELPENHHLSPDLAYIHLERCKLEEDPMPKLEKLPNLRALELHKKAFIGKKLACSAQGFPKLESLSLKDLSQLEEWKVDEGAMPCLQRLQIGSCRGLKMLPDGLRFITTLQQLKIEKMPKAFKERVEKGEEDFDKVRYIPSITFKGCV
ncbi:hypothetical protein V6N11_079008 [Hibiscus sabdariffa]|uniref:Disease resistance protein n=1 Tax=Hibiscus sabdariffa TaxID=183260 RepID=A0ABR2RU63_9ROSI